MDRFDLKTAACQSMVIAAMLLCVFGGCGKKAAPAPPQLSPVPPTTTLKVEPHGTQVTLSWRCAPCDPSISGYVIYRSGTDLSAPECPGCPVLFEKVDRLETGDAQQPYAYTLDLAPGYHYRLKVTPFLKSGALGPDSNVVQIETKP